MKLNCHQLCSHRAPAAPENGAAPRAVTVPAHRGIALVITLVMLSVTLVMAVAFLALARRERNSVSTATDTTTAKLAADSALATAQAQIMANVLAEPNSTFNFGLLISTNFINPLGFDPNSSNPTNVNYNYYLTTPGPLSQADFLQNVANLKYLPRVPVFIQTNPGTPLDFRFYLDLNRNGQFDDTGNDLPDILENGATNGFGITQTGDPQWVGILARPDATHSPNNLFLSRYAFIAVPIGNGLDINSIHNQPSPKSQALNGNYQNYGSSAYLRNQGVGSWEINLAAFLADLNTNQWDVLGAGNDYRYLEPQGNINTGAAFEDALSILSHRYNYSYNYLYPLSSLFGFNGVPLQDQPFDLNPTGPLLTNTTVQYYANQAVNPWAGSDNTNRFYDLPSELFNPTETSPDFTNRLISAGTENGAANPSTYDRYTFYRMLAQMGTDSDPDDGKMNLNYRNVVNGVVVPGMETNCFAWSPLEFFTNAADRMLRLYTTNWFAANPAAYLQTYYGFNPGYYTESYFNASGFRVTNDPSGFGLTNISFSRYLGWTNIVPAFGITNIPVYINGQFVYSPAVNRVLQMAANLYDASTTNYYPSVFRPLFQRDILGNIFVVGYTNLQNGVYTNAVSGLFDAQLSAPFDPTSLTNYGFAGQTLITNGIGVNVYGVPWIIGAKKGFPAFNKFGMQTIVQATRKLQITRSSIPTDVHLTKFTTNQLIAFSIKNLLNADCWNSYTNAYTNTVYIQANDVISMEISNNVPGAPQNFFYNYLVTSNTFINPWPGYNPNFAALSFTNPLSTAVTLLSNADFYFGTTPPGVKGFYSDSYEYGWESNNYNLTFPRFTLLVTNRLQLYMLDASTPASGYHVIDYVELGGPVRATDLTSAIETNNPSAVGYGSNMWSQATDSSGLFYGIKSQIAVSQETIRSSGGSSYWQGGDASPNNQANIDGFCSFMGLSEAYGTTSPNNPIFLSYATNYVAQVPYTPTVVVSDYTSWQVNDPLVHYLASDLTFNGVENNSMQTGLQVQYNATSQTLKFPSFNSVNDRYQPWSLQYANNLPSVGPSAIVPTAFALAVKDPLVWSSDDWNFPTNLYPTVGWIGRVHRGTPWQTVYLKAHDVLNVLDANRDVGSGTNTWIAWTSDQNPFDAANSVPVQDRLLFELFTSRPNDNAVRGTLSVNQTNLADWSAVLSGVVVLTNTINLPPNLNPAFASRYRTSFPVQYGNLTIQPAALDKTVQNILTNINFARFGTNLAYGFTNADHVTNAFEHVGDILATPALTEFSPFLNVNAAQQEFGISDAEYEWLPQQIMGLVRGSSTPRYVIYGYGQALRPAVNGLFSSGSTFFGLVTNYQVVAESAVRAVVSVHAQLNTSGAYPVTNYTTRVESYNVLPTQ